jgi:hypothetical protein
VAIWFYLRAALVGVTLLTLSFFCLRGSFLYVSVARSNLCETSRSTNCFETEGGVVTSVAGDDEIEVTSLAGERETVGPYNGSWDKMPAPGTKVLLERWEGDEIAYVYVPANGSRYKTHGAPDRENPAAFAVLLAFLAVWVPRHMVTQRG